MVALQCSACVFLINTVHSTCSPGGLLRSPSRPASLLKSLVIRSDDDDDDDVTARRGAAPGTMRGCAELCITTLPLQPDRLTASPSSLPPASLAPSPHINKTLICCILLFQNLLAVSRFLPADLPFPRTDLTAGAPTLSPSPLMCECEESVRVIVHQVVGPRSQR